MTPERWALVKNVFTEAAATGAEGRRALLDRRCEGDPELRAEVVRLLDHHDTSTHGTLRAGGVRGGIRAGAVGVGAGGGVLHPSDRIGSYRVLEVLGEGGMGVVYLAEQERPRRTVALKVIKPGLASAALRRRFEQEAHVLGRLEHAGIARIFEAGMADGGWGAQPFFAMELVRGRPLTLYAREGGLGIRRRLELMAQVCDAVHHAHGKGVVHRDLKPGNILVNEAGEAKVLDFGVARAVDGEASLTTFQTDAGQLLGTIPYMSPEQAAGQSALVDTRSDVYSLGVVLFELLAERLPYDVDRKMAHEAVRMIREEEPARMSAISRTFRGDIETIVGKALQKERARRYQSAQELADDIRRHLANEPIRARPLTTRYQIAKFAKLHRAHEAAEAMAINRFLQDLLASEEPLTASGKEVTVRQILHQAAGRLDTSTVRDEPRLESEVRTSIALTYRALGHFDRALHHARVAMETRGKYFGERHPDTATSMLVVGQLLAETGMAGPARELLTRCLDVTSEIVGDASPELAEVLCALGGAELSLGHAAAALARHERALSLAFDGPPGRVGHALQGIGAARLELGDTAGAAASLRECLGAFAEVLPEGHWQLVFSRALLGRCAALTGDATEGPGLLARAWSDLRDNAAAPPARRLEVVRWCVEHCQGGPDPGASRVWAEELALEEMRPRETPSKAEG
jgi:serine/threonine protein kinase